jgi:calpain-7
MDHALEYYSESAELYLKAFKGYENDTEQKLKAREHFTRALDKAESIKKNSNFLSVSESPPLRTRSSSVASDRPSILKMHHRSSSVSSLLSIEAQCPTDDILTQKLSAAEIEVLKCTSNVNGKTFLPWIDETDLKEQFSYQTKYLDPEGSLRLSEKQIEKFGGWRRPADIMKYPQLICLISRYNIIDNAL